MHVAARVVAVVTAGRRGRVAIRIRVVDVLAIAVLVHPVVRDLGRPREGASVPVVAIVIRIDVVIRLLAGKHRVRRVTVAVPVSVTEPGGGVGRVFVDAPVAILVRAVAHLVGTGERLGVVIVAVGLRLHPVTIAVFELSPPLKVPLFIQQTG
jgi:hypothetical protein